MKKLSRRKFVSAITAGAGALLLGSESQCSAKAHSPVSGPFQLVKLGKTGIRTTALGMGTGYKGYNGSSSITRAGEQSAISLIKYAYDKGIRYFDCADSYGTHKVVMQALKGIPREKYVLGSKIWVRNREQQDILSTVDRFRKELNTDYIDIIQLHCITSPTWTEEYKSQMDILDNLKSKKTIRSHGVSIHSLEAMKRCIDTEWADIVHVRINPYGASMDTKNPDEVVSVVQQLRKAGKGIIGMKLIGEGAFGNDPEKINNALLFAFSKRTVDVGIVGFEYTSQIDDYVNRMNRLLG